MTNIRPRRFAHKGRVQAAGFLFNTDLTGVAAARRRIIRLWKTGVQVYSDGPNLFVRLPATVRVDCANAIATPLVQVEGMLSALPLSKDEVESLQAPSHSVVFAKSGVARVANLSSSRVEAPEKWIEVSAFKVVKVTSLGAAFAEPAVVAEPQPFDARSKLDGVPAEDLQRREALAALRSGGSGSGWNAGQQLRSWLAEAIGSISSGLRSLGQKQEGAGTTHRQAGPAQGPASQASQWLSRLGLRLLHTSRLARVLGRRQAEYLGKMMDMFERGDINEALKHAIPLNDFASLNNKPALGMPSPRANLSIRPWQASNPRSINLGADLMAYLGQLYRASFDRLVAQKRIEEAAFVLAELLRASEEAVAFLERHGKLKLAAELAEARGLNPGLVVRQWFIAGDIERAVRIARRTQVFAHAVARLEKQSKEKADKLRVLWAESMAEAGNYASAVDVLWPITSQRPRAREWMDRAIDVGGPVAARMLARKLTIAPEDFDDIRRRVLTFVEDESLEQQPTRASFAEALCFGDANKEAQTLARVTARAVLRDAGRNAIGMTSKQFARLIDFAADGPLRTDVPQFPSAANQSVNPLLSINCSAADCGSMPVHDAVLLPNGRMLVALGELGVRLLTPDGRTVTHFDQPAEKLVISDHCDRAIALAPRGGVWRLSRLDLIEWRTEDWCDAQIDAFAPNYDGSLWFVGAKGDFYAIDANARGFEALWRVPEAGHRVLHVARSESSCVFLTAGDGSHLEKWIYRLPLLTLRVRSSPPRPPDTVIRIKQCDAFSPDGLYADQSLYSVMDQPQAMTMTPLSALNLRVFEGESLKLELLVGDETCEPLDPEIFGSWVVSLVLAKTVMRVHVIDLQSGAVTAQLFLVGATHVSTRLTENILTVADDRGRVIAVDLRRNCSIRNFRI